MPYRRRAEVPLHISELLAADLRFAHETAQAAEAAFKIRIYIAIEQGMTTQDVANALGISQSAASKYRIQGEALYRGRTQTE